MSLTPRELVDYFEPEFGAFALLDPKAKNILLAVRIERQRQDLWATQPYRPAVWIEKAALLGVIEGVCAVLRVPYFANIGDASQTLSGRASAAFWTKV
jgi:hypothetical protein